MLALNRPLGVVDNLALFGDHADPERAYYVVTRPRLSSTETGPEMSFVKFQSADATEGGAGLLSFTTELIATEQQLESAHEHLTDQGIAEPRLVQVPWLGGKAYFGAALEEGDGFVERLLGEVTPDLMGGNRAMFSARLTDEGARLIEALVGMEGPSPLGVRYELEYAGIRPALDVRLRADYQRIYDELSVGFQFGVAYEGVGVRAGVESATQKLVESGAIQVEVLHFTDDADLHSRVDNAIKWFQDRILDDFFKSSLQPPAQENLLDRAIEAATALGASTLQDALADESLTSQIAQQLGISPHLLGMLGQGAGPGGAAGAGGQGGGGESTFALNLQFTFRDIRQEELKTITLDWREARAERRTAAPQGLLSSFGATPQIVEASETGEFWDRLHVNVRPLGDFDELGVDRMVVQLAYPDETDPETQKTCVFEPQQLEPQRFSAWTNGKPPRYREQTEVHFRTDGLWPGPPLFRGPWREQHSLELALHPISDVPRVQLELSPGTVRFEETPQVQIDLRIDGEQVDTHMISAESPTATFRRRVGEEAGTGDPDEASDADTLRLEARATWFLADGGQVTGDWETVEGNTFLVHRPWRGRRTLRLFPLLPDDFIEALVTLTVSENGRTTSREMRFEPGERRTKTIEIPSLTDPPPPVSVDVLVIRGDGSTFVGVPFETTDAVVMVRDRDGEHRQVKVRLLAGERLADHGVMAVQVLLLDAEDREMDSVVFTESQREPDMMLAPIPEEGEATVRYRVVRYALDGSARPGEVEEESGSELLIPAVPPS